MKTSSYFFSPDRIKAFLILLFLGLSAYTQTIFFPFVHDDAAFILENPEIADLNLRQVFSKVVFPDEKEAIINVYYRPLLELFYRIQYRFFNDHPQGYHAVNILLHVFNSFLIYSLLKFIVKDPLRYDIPLGAAVLFLLHPVQTESVACISGISNTLFAFLCLLSFTFYLYARQRGSWRHYILSLMSFFFSLLAKEQAVAFPLLVLTYGFCFPKGQVHCRERIERRMTLNPTALWWIGAFLVLTGYLFLRKTVTGQLTAAGLKIDGEFWLRILSIPETLTMYLGIIFSPHNLHYYRSVDILAPKTGPAVLLLIVVVFVFLILKSMHPSRRTWAYFGLGFFFVALLPTLNILPLINEYSMILCAEHFLYLPLLGMILFVLWTLGDRLYTMNSQRAPFQMTLIVWSISIVFFALTLKQNTHWRGEIPLFERVLRFERLGRVHFLLAKSYHANGEFQKALEEDQKALEIMQSHLDKTRDQQAAAFYQNFIRAIHFETARTYEALGDYSASAGQYQKVLAADSKDSVAHYNLGTNLLTMQRFSEAERHFQEASMINPDDLGILNNLAICYIQRGEIQQAEELFRRILEKDPQFTSAEENLERLLLEKAK